MPADVSNRQRKIGLDAEALARLTELLLASIGVPAAAEVGITLVSDPLMVSFNRQAMGKGRTTDVLAFPIDWPIDPGDPAPCLGDVVICLDRAVVEGERRGHGFQREFLTYLVHGLLHLVGHDDTEPGARASMERLTEEIVDAFAGCPTGLAP